MNAKALLVCIAGFALSACAHFPEPGAEYAFNPVTGTFDVVERRAMGQYVGRFGGGTSISPGPISIPASSINLSPGSFAGIGNCAVGGK
jgi:hypothetical protein